jgi:plastocyanin
MRSRDQILSLLLLLSPTATCCAATFQVHAYDGYFDPDMLVIQVGDTVTFDNLSSGGPTNVHAANAFRCAVGCQGDGTGATGNPSKAHWSDTLAFNKPGTFTYVSDRQASDGMVGTIRVVSEVEQTGQNIVGGLSGNWYDPAPNQSGHGFQIEVQPDNAIVAIWFVFTPDGSGQTWLYAQGAYDPTSNMATMPAYLSLGARFPPAFTHADDHVTQWGTLTFTFTDCSNGTMSWTSTSAAFPATGNMPIKRATKIAGLACP